MIDLLYVSSKTIRCGTLCPGILQAGQKKNNKKKKNLNPFREIEETWRSTTAEGSPSLGQTGVQ